MRARGWWPLRSSRMEQMKDQTYAFHMRVEKGNAETKMHRASQQL